MGDENLRKLEDPKEGTPLLLELIVVCYTLCPMNPLYRRGELIPLNEAYKSLFDYLISYCSRVWHYDGVSRTDFTSEFTNGLGLCALIHDVDNTLIKFKKMLG